MSELSSHFKEQVILGNVKHLRAKRLNIALKPIGNGMVRIVVALSDGDGLPLREVARTNMQADAPSYLDITGFDQAFDVRLA